MATSRGNRVHVATATSGTGTLTLGAAISARFLTPAEAGIANGETVRYLIEEGNDFELGTGVYSSGGPTLTRATVHKSKIGGTAGTAKMDLQGGARVRLVASAEDFAELLAKASNLSDLDNVVTARTNLKIVTLTESAYAALSPPDSDTIYLTIAG